MKTYIVYRCSLCGELFYETVADVADEQMKNACNRIISSDACGVRMCETHKCEDGSCGVAYFAGIQKEG